MDKKDFVDYEDFDMEDEDEQSEASKESSRPETPEKDPVEVERNKFRIYARNAEKKEKSLKAIIAVLSVIIVLLLITIVYIVIREKQDNAAFFNKDASNVTPAASANYKIVNNLEEVIKDFSADGFTASSEVKDGYEYLCLSTTVDGQEVKLYYQNEFKNKSSIEDSNRAFMQKGDATCRLSQEYDITKPEELVPAIIKLSDSGTGFLFIKESGGLPTKLVAYNISNMTGISGVEIAPTFQYYFAVKVVDEANHVVNVKEGECNYNFKISEDVFNKLADLGENTNQIISAAGDFTYEIVEDKFKFRSSVTVSENEYLGEFYGNIKVSNDSLMLDNAFFAAYADYTYEETDSDRIITPRESYLAERVIVPGDKSGRYAFPHYKNLEQVTFDGSKYSRDDNNIMTYTGGDYQIGVDVSKYQENVDWAKVKATGVKFAFVRTGYRGYSKGTIMEDEYAEKNLKGATENGISVGGYFFTQAITEAEAAEEAEAAVKVMKKAGLTSGLIVYDTEAYDSIDEARGNHISRELRTKCAKAFADKVKELGFTPVIYCNTRWAFLGIDLDSLSEYPLWYACYSDSMLLPYKVDIWQYSDKGAVDGVNGNTDMNIMFNDIFSK